jgi:superkiller protein 3
VGHYDLAVQLIEHTITILEAVYEESEDPAIERQFTVSNTNLGRLRLATGDHEGALESFDSALGLLGDDDSQDSGVLRAQCHFGSGLARFKLDALEDAMTSFETALRYAGDNSVVKGHVTVLLAQTLWAIDTDEARELAKTHLLQWFVHYLWIVFFFSFLFWLFFVLNNYFSVLLLTQKIWKLSMRLLEWEY